MITVRTSFCEPHCAAGILEPIYNFGHFWSWQDHFQLQSTSHSFHIACVDIVIFLVDSDSDSDVIVVPVYNPQDADG